MLKNIYQPNDKEWPDEAVTDGKIGDGLYEDYNYIKNKDDYDMYKSESTCSYLSADGIRIKSRSCPLGAIMFIDEDSYEDMKHSKKKDRYIIITDEFGKEYIMDSYHNKVLHIAEVRGMLNEKED